MNFTPKNVPSDKPLYYGNGSKDQVKAQNQFKSLAKSPIPGNNGVVVHAVGCSGNHLGKC